MTVWCHWLSISSGCSRAAAEFPPLAAGRRRGGDRIGVVFEAFAGVECDQEMSSAGQLATRRGVWALTALGPLAWNRAGWARIVAEWKMMRH